jgi:hypothetical protein
MNFPAAGFSGEGDLRDARGLTLEAFRQVEIFGGPAEQLLFGTREHALTGAIHKAQAAVAIEGKDSHVNFFHHLAKQRGGLERAQPLLAQRFAECIHLAQYFAERVFHIRAARSNRKVAFAQSSKQIRESTQGKYDAALGRECEAQPGDDHDYA